MASEPTNPSDIRPATLPLGEPRPEDFGLTPARIAVFEKKDLGLLGRAFAATVGCLSFVLLVAYLKTHLPHEATDTLLFLVVCAVFAAWLGLSGSRRSVLREMFLRSQPDHLNYQRYSEARASFRSRLYAELRAKEHEEEARKRSQVEWWGALDGLTFEQELAKFLRGRGYEVTLTKASGDQGVDLFLKAAGKTVVVQCKAHAAKVGPAVARELYGSLIHFRADEAWLVTTSGFHRGVERFAAGKPIRLMTIGEMLEKF